MDIDAQEKGNSSEDASYQPALASNTPSQICDEIKEATLPKQTGPIDIPGTAISLRRKIASLESTDTSLRSTNVSLENAHASLGSTKASLGSTKAALGTTNVSLRSADASLRSSDAIVTKPTTYDISVISSAVKAMMSADRKISCLKTLQGHMWRKGYHDGKLIGHLYPDVSDSLQRWVNAGLRLFVYSSGSVEAQKLLFGHTSSGDINKVSALVHRYSPVDRCLLTIIPICLCLLYC